MIMRLMAISKFHFKQKGGTSLLFFLLFFSASAQSTLTIQVLDSKTKEAVPYPRLISDSLILGDVLGNIEIDKKTYKNIVVSAWNYDTAIVNIQNHMSDTLIIMLQERAKQLNEVVLSQKHQSWMKRLQILGFEFWHNGLIFNSYRSIFVTDFSLNLLYEINAQSLRPSNLKGIIKDALNNIFLEYKDEYIQVHVTDSTIYLYPAISKDEYKNKIERLLCVNDQYAYFQALKTDSVKFKVLYRSSGIEQGFKVNYPYMHNSYLELFAVNQGEAEDIYFSFDTLRYEIANEAFNEFVSLYVYFWQNHADSGGFSDKLKYEFISKKHTYDTYLSYAIKPYMINDNGLVLVDPISMQMVGFDKKHTITKRVDLPSDMLRSKNQYFFLDIMTYRKWVHTRKRGVDSVVEIGFNSENNHVDLGVFATNIRVHNNKVFFINGKGELEIKRIE
jgi:hypothetical protein